MSRLQTRFHCAAGSSCHAGSAPEHRTILSTAIPRVQRLHGVENQCPPRVGHTEACRLRIEEAIGGDTEDDRTKKAKANLDHYTANVSKLETSVGTICGRKKSPIKRMLPMGKLTPRWTPNRRGQRLGRRTRPALSLKMSTQKGRTRRVREVAHSSSAGGDKETYWYTRRGARR